MDEDSASPGSAAPDDIAPTPPSPCLDDADDDATPRQQWSPMHTLARARTQPNAGYSTNFAGVRGTGGSGGLTRVSQPAVYVEPSSRADSPVLRVDLERLDLSILALGDESLTNAIHSERSASSSTAVHGIAGGRPRSLGGRPSRSPPLFVAPGNVGSGPSSPPSSYSTHSDNGFASPRSVFNSQGSRELGRVRKGHWKKGKPIGLGSCGNVYLGMNEDTGELMAVKEITLEAKERLLCSLYNEIQVMHKLVHPHIVGYLGAELQDSQRKLCIFQEWVPAGSLHSILDQFGALGDAMTRKYTGQVLEGLAYLHANRVIHRDVKSKNVLVDDRGNVKLADFGCAMVLKEDTHGEEGVEMSMKGTPLFMAPEMLLKRKCGRRVDIWSLGCAVLEMVTTRPPWADAFKHPVEIIAHFSENPGPPPLPAELAPGLRHFLLSCFTWDPEVRPSAAELLSHPYLRARIETTGENPGDDVPLEEMDRASAVTRMRRCSSANLDFLAVQARQAALGVSIGALSAFGTAPSGSLRPPSPRYAPGGMGTQAKRTPTRRRMYGTTGVPDGGPPPPDTIAPTASKMVVEAAASAPCDRTRRSMASCCEPSAGKMASPDKRIGSETRRPGRGSAGGNVSEDVDTRRILRVNTVHTGGDDARQPEKIISSSATPGSGVCPNILSGSSLSRSAGPKPLKTPAGRELPGVSVTGGSGPTVDLGPVSDTPPPTVRPLEARTAVRGSEVLPPNVGSDSHGGVLRRATGMRGFRGAVGAVSDARSARSRTSRHHE